MLFERYLELITFFSLQFQKNLIRVYIYIRFTRKIYAFMEAKSLFTEFLIVTDRGRAVSVCLSWNVVSFRSSLWRNKDK